MNRFASFLSLIFSLLCGALYGQPDTTRVLDTLRIQEVPFSPVRSSRPMQILNSKDLRISQATNVAEAIQHMAGVQLRDYGGLGGMKTLDVRSMGAHHTGLIYNGMPVNNAQNGIADLGRFSLNNLSAIRLYNGQPGDLSLPARAFASASALILEPAHPSIEPGRSSFQAGITTGSFGLFNPALDWQHGLSDQTSFRLSTEWKQWDGGYPYRQRLGNNRDSLMDRMNSDLQALRIESIVQGTLDSARSWSVNAYAYLAQRGLPGPSMINNYYQKDRQWDEDLFLQGNIQAYTREKYGLYVYGKYRYHTLRYLDPDANTSQGFIDNRYFEHSIDLSAVQVYRWDSAWTSALAADYTFQTLDASLRDFAYPRRHTALLNLSSAWEQGRWTVQGNVLATLWKEQSRYQHSVEQKPIFSPSLAASYRPWTGENLYLRLFYKSIFRMPTFNDRYYTFVGSVDLRPEHTRQYNLGITWGKTWSDDIKLQGTLDLYRNHIKDRITAIPTSNIFRWTMVNLGQVEIKGMDVSIQANGNYSDGLSWQAGLQYTWQDARDQTPEGYHKGSWIPYAPQHSGSGTVSVVWKSWGFRYSLDYTGMRYSQRWNAPENQLDSSWIQHASVSYSKPVFSVPLRLIASVHNLAHIQYAVIPNFPMPGRHYRIQLQIQLN